LAGLNVRHFAKSLHLDERGTTALEFALIAPVMLAMLIGTILMSIGLFLIGGMHYAVDEAARCASVKTTICTDSATTIAYAQSHFFGPNVTPVFNYTTAACGNSVSATYTYSMNIVGRSYSIPITANACYP
jgi:Flp pilus assembly protein TadG